MDTIYERVRQAWANFNTLTTCDAPICVVHEFWTRTSALRIVTPKAGQRAALQEDCRANPRSIVNGESLDVKDDALF